MCSEPSQFAVQPVQVAQRGEIIQRKSHRIENRHVPFGLPAGLPAAEHVGELSDGRRGIELLDLALDPRLRFEFDHDARIRTPQDVGVQFGLAGAITAHRVQVHAGFNHVGRQDECVALIGGDRGDDIGAAHRLGGVGTASDFEGPAGRARRD